MAFAPKRTRIRSLQENSQYISKVPSCRKRIFSDTDTTLKIRNQNENTKKSNRNALQDIQNTNNGAIPKLQKHRSIAKLSKDEKIGPKIQTPKLPRAKKSVNKLNIKPDGSSELGFVLPKHVTVSRGQDFNNSSLPDLISDSFTQTNLDFEQLEGISRLDDKDKEMAISKRKRAGSNDDEVHCEDNKENLTNKKKYSTLYEPEGDTQVFSKVYLEDAVQYYFGIEEACKSVLETSIIMRITIDWLIEVNESLNSDPNVLFAAAILFNQMLCGQDLTWHSTQLAGLACFRIIYKYFNAIMAPWNIIVSQIRGDLSDLNRMEQDILQTTKFKTDIAEPTIFLYYYLSMMRDHHHNRSGVIDQKIEYCALYIQECFLLSPLFYTRLPSEIAAASIQLALEIFQPESCCWSLLVGNFGYYSYSELKSIRLEMVDVLAKSEIADYSYRSAFLKYSRINYQNISQQIKDNDLVYELLLRESC